MKNTANPTRIQSSVFRKGLSLLACALALLVTGYFSSSTNTRFKQAVASTTLHGTAAVEQLRQDGSYSSLAAALQATRYHAQARATGESYVAANAAQQFEATFSGAEVRLEENVTSKPRWQFGMKLTEYGYGENLAPVAPGVITAQAERVEIQRAVKGAAQASLTEWYVNQAEGLEQGFTLHARPAATAMQTELVRLRLQVTGGLHAALSSSGQALVLKDPQGRAVLSYGKLAAWDANHQALPATMRAEGRTITLEVDDAKAVYPVTIDPLIAQQAKLVAADGMPNDTFGTAVALSGNIALVGAPGSFVTGVGAAYVFIRSGNSWTLQAKLNAPDGAAGDNFGRALALDGQTAALGAPYHGGKGAVYVFTRSGASWSLQQKLSASDGQANNLFGNAVALQGETLLAGALYATVNGNNSQGAAYVFTRNGTAWNQQAKLTAADGASNHGFGNAVALDGNTALIGASQADFPGMNDQGAAYVFWRSGATWSQLAKLVASDGAAQDQFGGAVSLSGDTAVIGAHLSDVNGNSNQGSAYVFTRNGSAWNPQQKLLSADGGVADAFGKAVAISGNLIAIGATDYDLIGNQNQGAVYLFTRSGGAWSQQTKFRALDGAAYDALGNALALSGTTLLVGAGQDDVGANQNQGSAYTFVITEALVEGQEIYLDPGQLDAEFGYQIALEGNTAVIGARYDQVGGLAKGAVYVYVRNGASWSQQQKLSASDGAGGDQFGFSVALHGETLVVGAPFKPNGAAYVFTRSNGVWTQQQKLVPANSFGANWFGWAVALKGNTALVGAINEKIGLNNGQGATYVFTRSGAVWSQQQQLTSADGGAGDHFGAALAMTEYVAVIGAVDDTINGLASQGSVYLFGFNGASWSQQQKLTSNTAATNQYFGSSVALDSGTLLVGAPGNGNGSAFVLVNNGATWTLQQQLFANDGAAGHGFGNSVALSGELAVIGAPKFDAPAKQDQGAAYLFERRGTTWSQQQKLTATDAQGDDQLGWSVAIAGPEILASAYRDDYVFGNSGSVYYFRSANCPTVTINNATLPDGALGVSYNQQLSATGGSGPYDFAFVAGVLPPGLTLSPSGLLFGTPAQAGTYSFTITALTPSLCSGSQTYTVTVPCAPITLTPASLPPGTVGQGGYNQPLVAQGGVAPYTFSLLPGDVLPPGLSLVNGALVGGPQQSGVFNFTIKATDAQGCSGVRQYTFTANCQSVTVFPALFPTLSVGVTFSQGLSAAGSDGPFTYALESGALPNGLTLTTEGLIAGTPTASGNGNFTVKAFDVYGCATLKQYSYNVACPALTLNPPSLPNGATGVAYNQTLTTTGGLPPYSYSVTAGSLPPGLSLAASGALTGTPTLAGTFNFTATMNSGGCTAQQSYALTIAQSCGGLTLHPGSLPNGTTGANYNVQLTTTGANGSVSYEVSAGTLPNGVILSSAGLLTGTPAEMGNFNFTVTATDANSCAGQKSYTLTVNCPTITVTSAPPNGSVGNAYQHMLNATGNVGPYSYSVTAGSLPTGVTLSSAGALTGTPASAGTFNFTIRAESGSGCSGETSFAVTITTCQAINIAQANLPDATVGTAYNLQLNASGGVGPYAWSLPAGILPNGLNITPAGLLVGTPTQAGNFAVSLRATDVNGCVGDWNYVLVVSAAGCSSMTVNPATLPNGMNGAFYSQQLTASGGTGSYTFALTAGSLPAGLTLSPTGWLSGTLAAIGIINFRVTATDGNLCVGSREYQLTSVNCSAITLDPVTLPAGQMGAVYQQTLTASGGTQPYSYSVTVGALPNGLNLSTAGVLSGTPTVNGQFGFTVTATAANGCTGARSYNLTLGACPTLTLNPASLPNGSQGLTYNQTLTATGGTGPYSYAVTSGALPTGLNLTGAGALSGTPTVSGSFNFTVTATDANGCTGQRAYTLQLNVGCSTLTINPATLPVATAGVTFNQTLTQTGGNGTINWSVSAGALPAGWTLTASTGQLSGLSLVAGVFNFTLKATDANGCLGTRAYTLTIRPKAKADFDGDGKTDLGVWTGATGDWKVLKSGNGASFNLAWGAGYAPYNDVIVPGDYDGDGKADHAIWRGADSIWYIRKSSDGQAILDLWGANYAPYNDIPTPGDFDGDGKTDLAVWRPTTGTWYVKQSSDGANLIVQHGQQGDIPLAADFDGDGKCDFGLFRPAAVTPTPNWHIRQSTTNSVVSLQWGGGYAPYFDVPVPADYDGDGKADLAIWRGADTIWYIRPSATPNSPILELWGANYAPYFDVPAPADYDGDGKADIAVWRPTDGNWFIKRSSNGTNLIQGHGQQGDVPIPAHGVK